LRKKKKKGEGERIAISNLCPNSIVRTSRKGLQGCPSAKKRKRKKGRKKKRRLPPRLTHPGVRKKRSLLRQEGGKGEGETAQ